MFQHVHLQWFGDPPPAAGDGVKPGEAKPGEGTPAGTGESEPLTADGKWAAQLPDRFKKNPEKLKDLLRHKNLGEVVDRLYAAEGQASQQQAAAAGLQAKLTATEARAAELEKGAGQPPELKLEDYAKVSVPKLPTFMSQPAFEAYTEDLGAYLKATGEEIKALAHELKLPVSAAQSVLNLFAQKHLEAFKAGLDEQASRRTKGLEILKAEWKGDFTANEELAKRAIRTFGSGDVAAQVAYAGYANDPMMIKLWARVGAALGEGHLVPGRPGPSPEGARGAPSDPERAASLRKRYNRSPELHT